MQRPRGQFQHASGRGLVPPPMLPRAHGGLRRPDQCLASFRKPRVRINERGIMVRLPLADPRMSALPPIATLLDHDAMSG